MPYFHILFIRARLWARGEGLGSRAAEVDLRLAATFLAYISRRVRLPLSALHHHGLGSPADRENRLERLVGEHDILDQPFL